MYGTFVPGNENVVELSFPGAKTTWNFRSQERKCHGTFVPGSENDVELSLPGARML